LFDDRQCPILARQGRHPRQFHAQFLEIHTMQTLKLSLALALLALAPLAFGQLASQARPANRALGYYDPTTGIFEPLHPLSDTEPATATPTTGTLTFTFTITAKSTLPKNAVIGCEGDAGVSDPALEVTEKGTGVAKLSSGTTYTCTAVIHYSWLLSTASSDKISLSYNASIDYGLELTGSNGTGTVVTPIVSRSSTQDIPGISVPANGASTTEDISITL
jgi:hypothetical protein